MLKIPDALLRLLVVVIVLGSTALIFRFYVLPASVTDVDLHKRNAVSSEMAKSPKYAGSRACSDCHVDEPLTVRSGYHATLSCETCHGPAQAHVVDPEVKPDIPSQRDFCPLCHAFDASRPTGFPQINPIAHNPLTPCIQCHNPHDPKPPETPHECSACHAEIARTKAVSPHVGLECTTCHTGSENHKATPRAARLTKPAQREFCGTCHGEDSEVQGTPKVAMDAHGNGYLCWQCHYPHQPEGR